MGLQKIYEMVINTNPSYAYLMKSNNLVDQKTVMAHVYGHVDFFKNNYWFSKTNRKMLDTMANHAVRIRNYMDRYGPGRVENFIDRCLTIENLIDPYLPFINAKAQKSREEEEDDEAQALEVGKLKADRARTWTSTSIRPSSSKSRRSGWSRPIERASASPPSRRRTFWPFCSSTRRLSNGSTTCSRSSATRAYYFAPQAQTKIMNEGWASYWHSKIMTEKALERFGDHRFLRPSRGRHGHAARPDQSLQGRRRAFARHRGSLEPRQIRQRVRRVRRHGRQGQVGQEARAWAARRSSKCARSATTSPSSTNTSPRNSCERYKLYTYQFNRRTNQYEIADRDFRKVKEKMLFGLSNMGQPFVYVMDGNFQNKGELLLWHKHQGLDLDVKWSRETMRSLSEIWKRPVNVETEVDGQKKLFTYINGEFSEKFL